MIPYSRPKLSDFYTLYQTKLLENHTLHSGIYPFSLYTSIETLDWQVQSSRRPSLDLDR